MVNAVAIAAEEMSSAYRRIRIRCPSVKARSSPETLAVRATSEVVKFTVVGCRRRDAPGRPHRRVRPVGVHPRHLTAKRSVRGGVRLQRPDVRHRHPGQRERLSCFVNQSTTVPPAVSVTWIGAVQPAAVFRTSVCTPAPGTSTPPDPPMPSPRRRPCRSGTAPIPLAHSRTRSSR